MEKSVVSSKKPKESSACILPEKVLNELKAIGHCILITSSKDGYPRGSIVEPSFFYETEIVIPVVQLNVSYKNIRDNKNIFLHFVKENKEDYGYSTQFKIRAVAEVENDGELFEKAKHFEESERLPEDMKVRAIIRAKVTSVEVVEG